MYSVLYHTYDVIYFSCMLVALVRFVVFTFSIFCMFTLLTGELTNIR